MVRVIRERKYFAAATTLLLACVLARAQEKVRAEAEVTAKKTPVQITLQLYKKMARLGKNNKVSLWAQIELKNIGTQQIPIVEDSFLRSTQISLQKDYGVYLEAIAADGHKLWTFSKAHDEECEVGEDAGWEQKAQEEEVKARAPLLEKMEREHLSFAERQERLSKWLEERNDRFRQELRKSANPDLETTPTLIQIQPGESVRTKAWVDFDPCDAVLYGKPRPKPLGDFSEVTDLIFSIPGTYRLRAVYDSSASEGLLKDAKEGRFKLPSEMLQPYSIRVQTPFVAIKILPKTAATKAEELKDAREAAAEAKENGNKTMEEYYEKKAKELEHAK